MPGRRGRAPWSRSSGRKSCRRRSARYLAFGDLFEKRFLAQRQDERRTIGETLDLAWETLAVLPESELTRIPEALLEPAAPGPRPAALEASA